VRVKQIFELIYKTTGKVQNVVSLNRGTLKAYEIEKIDFDHIIMLAKSFSRIKQHPASKIIDSEAQKLIIVRMDSYPLPAFVTNKGYGVINLSVLPARNITDYSSSDVYSMFLYTIALKYYISKTPFKLGIESNVAGMIFSIFMKVFGKKAGLIGSYKYLIPKLQFLIYLYVSVSMVGYPNNNSTIKKIGSITYTDPSELKLDYDFNNTSDFLKSINDNDIIPLSENKFSSTMINSGGVASLPMFEDLSRFFATLLACGIPNSQFSYIWAKINTNLYNKLVDMGLRTLARNL